mmetsp:Transcript_72806/g.168759  ORF Transcript_72806/g.168759 Transcript_72806/m.168759 type:complete len:228 (-) Transcript_72806:97-780(-)
MPIDYSKFDGIGEEEEEEDNRAAQGGANLSQLLECLQHLGEERGTGVPFGLDPHHPPPPPAGDLLGDEFDPSGSSRPLDMEGLRAEAWHLLVSHLVVRPDSTSVPRTLLLEAELNLLASQYRPALVAALALQMAGDAGDAGGHGIPGGQWAVPSGVVEMVACYQLGDRGRAVMLRDNLLKADRSLASKHLIKRFEGTSEVLELVPEFLNLLKSVEHNGGASDRAARN